MSATGVPASLRDVIARTSASRMLREQPEQFDAGVAGAADDADLDHGVPSDEAVRARDAILASPSGGSAAAWRDRRERPRRRNDEGRLRGGPRGGAA